jgi:hypothetical protein
LCIEKRKGFKEEFMKSKRLIGIILVLCGLSMIGLSLYIENEVAHGRIEISRGEAKLKNVDRLFSLSPTTKGIGKGISRSGEKQIKQGKKDVAYYTNLAHQLKIGGVVLLVIGAWVYFLGRKKRKG